jgi:hypothetical protein
MKLAAYVILGLALLAPPNALKTDALKTDDLEADLKAFYVRQAAAYEFRPDTKSDERFTLERKPVLTWTNVEKYMGSVFVWTRDGRPEVIGCIGSHQNKPGVSNFFHEFHSLSQSRWPPSRWPERSGLRRSPGWPWLRSTRPPFPAPPKARA